MRRRFFKDTESLGLAARYLREEAGLTQQQVVEGIEQQSRVKIRQQTLFKFEGGKPTLGREKIDGLLAFHGCATPQEMIEKANHAAGFLDRDEEGALQSKAAGAALVSTLRRILDRPFHRMERLATDRSAQETTENAAARSGVIER